ncbi:MAG TPA: hypothetical protein VGB18_01530 [Candidatus Thermoplasmatota archaeon]
MTAAGPLLLILLGCCAVAKRFRPAPATFSRPRVDVEITIVTPRSSNPAKRSAARPKNGAASPRRRVTVRS